MKSLPNMPAHNSDQPTQGLSPQHVASKLTALDVGEKTVLLNFNGGFLSSDAGALLLREVEDHIGLIRKMAEVIPDSRDARYITHTITDLLIQRVAQIACGYEDADDCDLLREDPIFKMIAGRYPELGNALGSQPTMSRFENSISRTTLYRLARVFADIFIASYAEEPDCIVLDFDDTDDPVHGEQQLALFNTYYKEHCFMPLHVYEGQSGKLVTTILKPGKRAEGKQMLALMTRLITHLRTAWPNTMILVRGDSHFAYPEVMEWIEAQPHGCYLTGLSGNARLKAAVQPIVELAQRSYRLYGDNLTRFYAFQYQADSWNRPRRVVAKIELTDKGLNLRFVVTNIQGLRASTVYKEGYCPRGEDELYIKEHKLYLKSDRTSCSKFEANQFRVFLHSAAYVLLHSLKTNILQHTPFSRASIQTIRLRVLKIGARIREWKTRITVELPTNFPLQDLLRRSFGIVTQLRSS
jgi:hypothetical protein